MISLYFKTSLCQAVLVDGEISNKSWRCAVENNSLSSISVVLRSFLGLAEGEELRSAKAIRKASILAIGRVIYGISDWAFAVGMATMVFWMEAAGFSGQDIFLTCWLYDFIVASVYFFASDMSGCDFTFAQSLRRVANHYSSKSMFGWVSSALFLAGFSVYSIIWSGPETVCMLFRQELRSRSNIVATLFGLSALQGLFWSYLYSTGYERWLSLVPEVVTEHYVLFGILTYVVILVITELLRRIFGPLFDWIVSRLQN